MFSTIKFNWYYINFQLPYRRSSCGFDTLDLDLDLVIDPQFKWTWKDEAEYWAGIREGGILDKWVRGIERAKDRVFERIKQRAPPSTMPGWIGAPIQAGRRPACRNTGTGFDPNPLRSPGRPDIKN